MYDLMEMSHQLCTSIKTVHNNTLKLGSWDKQTDKNWIESLFWYFKASHVLIGKSLSTYHEYVDKYFAGKVYDNLQPKHFLQTIQEEEY